MHRRIERNEEIGIFQAFFMKRNDFISKFFRMVGRCRKQIDCLGADGFGFSDTRAAARRYYNIDGPSIAVAVLQQLALKGEVPREWPLEAARRYRLDDVTAGASGKTGDSE